MSDVIILLGAQWEEIMLLFGIGAVLAVLSQAFSSSHAAADAVAEFANHRKSVPSAR
jgi:hypothetical protein